MLRKTTRREKRAAARLTKMMRRSLGKWGRAERPSRALPDVSTLDRQATEVNCSHYLEMIPYHSSQPVSPILNPVVESWAS